MSRPAGLPLLGPALLGPALLGLLVAAVLGATTASAAYGVSGDPVSRRADEPVLTGYAIQSLAPRVVVRDAEALGTVTVAGTMLRAGGASVSAPTRDARRLLRTAHEQGLRAEIIVSSYSNRSGDFDPRALHRMLGDPARREAVAAATTAAVRRHGWDGVDVDLERVRADDASGLVAFVRALRERLPGTAAVSIDVSARTSRAAYLEAGYRLETLGRVADLVQLMTYDQHGPTWTGPGPVGALDWQRRALDAALALVPADRLDVGVAGYGYTWPTEGSGRSVTVAQARRIVAEDGASATWDDGAGEWTATLSDGTVLWWSDARSLALRHDLAVAEGLHGVALWRLGSADPLR